MDGMRVGGETDAFCTRCKLLLAHTIVAIWAGQIKRVRCNTCMGEHAYRAPGGATTAAKPSRPRSTGVTTRSSATKSVAAKAAANGQSYVELLVGKDRSQARRYSPKEKFEVGELVEHPSFGLGVVAAARGIEKVDIAFPDGAKTLMHNRGGAPSFARPLAAKTPDVALVDESREPDPAAETSDE